MVEEQILVRTLHGYFFDSLQGESDCAAYTKKPFCLHWPASVQLADADLADSELLTMTLLGAMFDNAAGDSGLVSGASG